MSEIIQTSATPRRNAAMQSLPRAFSSSAFCKKADELNAIKVLGGGAWGRNPFAKGSLPHKVFQREIDQAITTGFVSLRAAASTKKTRPCRQHSGGLSVRHGLVGSDCVGLILEQFHFETALADAGADARR